MGILRFTSKTKEPVYLFLAEDKQYPKVSRSEMLGIGDKSSDIPGSGIFPFTKGMPIIINSNCRTALGIVNEKEGRAIRVTFDPKAEVMYVGNNVHIVSLPPMCVYVEIEKAKFEQLDGLDRNDIPIFRQSMSVYVSRQKVKESNVIRWKQDPCSPS